MAEQLITSRDNGRLMAARRVRDGRDKFRIFVEGRRLAEEAVKAGLNITECFLSEAFADDALASAVDAPVFRMPEKVFKTLADTENPQGVILVAERPRQRGCTNREIPIAIFLSEINNPSNLGAILRTADAAGVEQVILSQGSADPYSPKALRASMGSAFRLFIREGERLADVVAAARERSTSVTGVDVKGQMSYTDIDWSVERVLVFGSEAHGLSANDVAVMDETIRIPMASEVESLNLAVSAGVILFEARRQLLVH
jgi:TrmH family RNA methyltransferase